MIQRKQTLFLIGLIFLNIALMFVPIATVLTKTVTESIRLVPLNTPEVISTSGHLAAIALNFISLLLTFITIFVYRKRELQVKLCYALVGLWLILGLMITLCPLVVKTEGMEIHTGYSGIIICAFAILAAFLAARFIKKDIALLKSADRIR